MKIKNLISSLPSPRIMLVFPAILIMLLAMLAGALALTYDNQILAATGIILGMAWMAMLILIALPQTDRWCTSIQHWFKPFSAVIMGFLVFAGLVELLALLVTGLGTTEGGILGASTPKFLAYISHDLSSSDAVALLDQAVDNLMNGNNPYAEANVVEAVIESGSPYDKTTPLRLGRFAHEFPYPSNAQIDAVWLDAIQTPEIIPIEIESKLGYPAGFFVIPALFSWIGIHNIRIVALILILTALITAIILAEPRMRLWIIGASLGSLVIWNGIASGMTGSLYFPFLLLAWVLVRKNLWVSAICMGVAIATKQVVWFFLPFYLIFILKNLSFKHSVISAGIAASVFLGFNLPFIIAGPVMWLDSVFSTMKDALFPSGWGIITFTLQGWITTDSALLFAVMEGMAFVATLTWYWFNARRYPLVGIVLPLVPLFFAWRSLWTYFFYVDIILLVAVIQEYTESRVSARPA